MIHRIFGPIHEDYRKTSLGGIWLISLASVLAMAIIYYYISALYSALDAIPDPIAVPVAKAATTPQIKAVSAQPDPCGLKAVVCKGEKQPTVYRQARITYYNAVPEQTDSTPCIGAMAGVDFCHPPFPIVANNCLKLGTKVKIVGKTYTVADRKHRRYGCEWFDILNGKGLPSRADVTVLSEETKG